MELELADWVQEAMRNQAVCADLMGPPLVCVCSRSAVQNLIPALPREL